MTFEFGARTPWDTRPPGQTPIVTARFGRAQGWRGLAEAILPAGVIWLPLVKKREHGQGEARQGPSRYPGATHGKTVEWMEHASGRQYQGGSRLRKSQETKTADRFGFAAGEARPR